MYFSCLNRHNYILLTPESSLIIIAFNSNIWYPVSCADETNKSAGVYILLLNKIMANEKNSETAVEAKVATKKNAGKGRTPKSPVWKVLDDARKKFNAQIVKSTSVKRECIKACIGKYYADDLRFWLDLLSQSEKLLLDSMRFNKACDNLGLAPKTVAQHILFESEKTAKRVLIEGVEAVLGERVKMFTEPLYVDEKKLYANSSSNVQETPSEASATSGSAVTAA